MVAAVLCTTRLSGDPSDNYRTTSVGLNRRPFTAMGILDWPWVVRGIFALPAPYPQGTYRRQVIHFGLSIKDDNIRRLLHYSKAERVDSYQREGVPAREAEDRSVRHFAILTRSEAPEDDDLTALSLQRLGVRVLWLDTHSELPEVLAALYSSASEAWDQVY